jgi:hypothetical protein
MILSIATFSITTLWINGLCKTLSIYDTQHTNALHYTVCHYAVSMLNVSMLNVSMLNVSMLNVSMLNASMLSFVMLNAVMLNIVAPYGHWTSTISIHQRCKSFRKNI